MMRTVAPLAMEESRGGLQVVIYEAQVVSMECERVERGRQTRVRNLLRQWEEDIICLLRQWVVNMWIGATQLLDGPPIVSCLCGTEGLWSRSKSVWGNFLLHARLEMSKMVSLGLLQGVMGLILIVIEGYYGRNSLACLVGGICRGALEAISTSPIFLMKYWVKLVFVAI